MLVDTLINYMDFCACVLGDVKLKVNQRNHEREGREKKKKKKNFSIYCIRS